MTKIRCILEQPETLIQVIKDLIQKITITHSFIGAVSIMFRLVQVNGCCKCC